MFIYIIISCRDNVNNLFEICVIFRTYSRSSSLIICLLCTCLLYTSVLSVPLAFFSGIGSGSKKGILFKGGVAIEALKNIKAVVMDKTGTITKGTFDVQRVVSLHRLTEKQILTMAADCEIASTHPVAVSIVAEAKNRGLKLVRPGEVEEIPGKGIQMCIRDRNRSFAIM